MNTPNYKTTKACIEEKLTNAFSPKSLNVIDESEHHRGHGGWREGGETHFKIEMTSVAFIGFSRIAMQRAVFSALKDEMDTQIHALSLDLRSK